MLRREKIKIVRFLIIALLWLGVMGVFWEKEIFPSRARPGSSFPGMEDGFPSLFRDDWLGIFFNGSQVGYGHTVLYPHREKGFYGSALDNTIWLEIPLWGKKNRVQGNTFCLFSSRGEIKRLNFHLEATRPAVKIYGRTEDTTLAVNIQIRGVEKELTLPLPRQALPLYSLTPLLALRPLKKGETFILPVIDLLESFTSRKLEPGRIRFEVADRTEEGYRLLAFYGGMTLDLWLDNAGRVLKISTPLGWDFVKQDHDEVIAFIKSLRPGEGSSDQ